MAVISNSLEPYRTGKRRLARILLGGEFILLGKMFIFSPSPEIISALAPYFAAYSALTGAVVLTAYGLAAYVNQVIPAQNGKTNNA